MAYKILYEDEWLLAVNKPSGILVIPTPKDEKNTLTSQLNEYLDSKGVEANAYPCHRLDRDTSGVIIYAKGKKSQKLIMELFMDTKVEKAYTAFVNGMVRKDSGRINDPIFDRNKNKAEKAITDYEVVKRCAGFTVLKVKPLTGRTNQIRIHMKRIGYPLLGERVFALGKDHKVKFRRTALHASSIKFIHPFTGEDVVFEAELAPDMSQLLEE